MKITAHMKSGDIHTWENLADVIILTSEWARLGMRGENWDTSIPPKDRKLGTLVLLNIGEMLYWIQEQEELDDEVQEGFHSWLEPGVPPGEAT